MYNEQVKLAFIEKYTDSKQTKKLLRHIFDGTKDIEERYGKDFYEMDAEQAQETFSCVSGTKVNGASSILMILKAYVRWCVANGYPATKAIQELRIDVHDKLRESYVASPEHLLKSLNEAFPNPDKNEIEYIYRSFLWLGFMGLQSSEAIKVTADHLDFDKMHLTYFQDPNLFPKVEQDSEKKEKKKYLLIYPEAVQDLRKAVGLTEFEEPRGKKGIKKPRAAGKEILRGKESKRTLAEAVDLTFRPTISRAFKAAFDKFADQGIEVPVELSLKLTFKHVYMSGVFYRTYERERMGIPPNFSDIVLDERRNAKASNFSRNYTERKLLNILIRDMEQDYDNWKSVFS